jgi:peptide chain release factor 3
VHLFERDESHGSRIARAEGGSIHDDATQALLGDATYERLVHDIQLLDEAGHPFSHEDVLAGTLSPVFFGSALTNFGVEPFLREFLELAPPPLPRESDAGPIDPARPEFTGFVFKIQANMDPKHRDRIAFVRVCSGKFEAGLAVTHVRTGKPLRLAAPQTFLARERTAVEEAFPGDVVGVLDRGTLRIGDTLSAAGPLEFQGIPRFAPEHFARIVPSDPMRRKHLDTGLRQLTEEGAAQVFFTSPTDVAGPTPIVGAVGMLQFDVMLHRLEHEYGVPCKLEHFSAKHPRWITGKPEAIAKVARERGRTLLYDVKGAPVILFESEWALRWALEREPDVQFHDVAP